MPFSTLLWKTWKRYSSRIQWIDRKEDPSDPETKYSAFRAHPGSSLQEALEESLIKTVRSCLLAAPFVFNWVDSLIVDPDELLLALSDLLLHSKVQGSVLWVGLEKSKCRNTFSGSAKIIYYFLKC